MFCKSSDAYREHVSSCAMGIPLRARSLRPLSAQAHSDARLTISTCVRPHHSRFESAPRMWKEHSCQDEPVAGTTLSCAGRINSTRKRCMAAPARQRGSCLHAPARLQPALPQEGTEPWKQMPVVAQTRAHLRTALLASSQAHRHCRHIAASTWESRRTD